MNNVAPEPDFATLTAGDVPMRLKSIGTAAYSATSGPIIVLPNRMRVQKTGCGGTGMSFVDIGGVAMHYHLYSAATEGPVLVFINSLGTDFRIWDDVADRLAGDVTLLNYDKRGHGLSGLGGCVVSMDDHVDDLAGLLDRLGIDDVILCGLSIGGLIAQGFAIRRPQALRALILCDTAAKIGTTES